MRKKIEEAATRQPLVRQQTQLSESPGAAVAPE
jgi:hypothetical protein